jgi:tetratricopeptide (TPR) repeat protein
VATGAAPVKKASKPVKNPEKNPEDFAPATSGSRANTGSYAPRYSAEGAASEDSDKKLVLTRAYFSNDPTPEKSYQYACEASGANFNNTDLYYRKAALLIQMGKFGKAMQQLTDVLVDDPNNEHYRLARAFCYAKQGMRALAAEDIRTAQFKNPKLPTKIEIGD